MTFHPEDDVALCALARLYLMTDDLDQCQYTCMTLLRKDKENEEGKYLFTFINCLFTRCQFVKARNMKMDFNTGGTWRQVGQ